MKKEFGILVRLCILTVILTLGYIFIDTAFIRENVVAYSATVETNDIVEINDVENLDLPYRSEIVKKYFIYSEPIFNYKPVLDNNSVIKHCGKYDFINDYSEDNYSEDGYIESNYLKIEENNNTTDNNSETILENDNSSDENEEESFENYQEQESGVDNDSVIENDESVEQNSEIIEEVDSDEESEVIVEEEIVEEESEVIEESEIEGETYWVPSYSIGYPNGTMKSYVYIAKDDIYNDGGQSYINNGNIVRFGGWFAGHNPGVFSYMYPLYTGDKVRISWGDGNYGDYVVEEITFCYSGIDFSAVVFSNGLNLWYDICLGDTSYRVIQYCTNSMPTFFLLRPL